MICKICSKELYVSQENEGYLFGCRNPDCSAGGKKDKSSLISDIEILMSIPLPGSFAGIDPYYPPKGLEDLANSAVVPDSEKQIYYDNRILEWRAVDRVCACGRCTNRDNYPECATTPSCWCNRPATDEEIESQLQSIQRWIALRDMAKRTHPVA